VERQEKLGSKKEKKQYREVHFGIKGTTFGVAVLYPVSYIAA
jgi:hypothetical protein